MSGLLRRLTRRRPATADETGSSTPESSEPAGAPAKTPAEPGGGQPAPDEQATQRLPATAEHTAEPGESRPVRELPAGVDPGESRPVRDLPAGIDPGELATAPAASANRGKLRRRVRYLRRIRELLLRDLGGFMFEVQRSAGGGLQEGHRRLMEAKTRRIAAVDAELRGLEGRLDEPRENTVLREPGIGGLCPECGELHASDAHYCARCGAPLDAKARARRDAAVAAAAKPAPQPSPAATSASVLWAGGPRPGGRRPADEEKSDPSAATSQWLSLSHHGPADVGAGRPAAKDEPEAQPDEPAAKHDEPAPDEPVAQPDESAATRDEPAHDEPAAQRNEPAHDEPAARPDEPAHDEPAAPDEPAAKHDEPAHDEPAAKPDEPIAASDAPSENGRRDDDVPPPVPDPLASRPEQGP